MKNMFLSVGIALTLVACGGGGGSKPLSQSELDDIASRPEVVRLRGIAQRADTLLIPRAVYRYTIRAQGESITDRISESMRCADSRCIGSEGTVVSISDLFDPEVETSLTAATFSSRDGFDMVTTTAALNFDDAVPEVTVTSFPEATEYGVWGEHGYAAATLLDGSFRGRLQGASFSGEIKAVASAAYGDAIGTNPTGVGSATWRGVAEGISSRFFDRRTGTATISIPDLSNPRVNAVIEFGGREIGSWTDISLSRGRYEAGYSGSGNHLVGNFHGPDHEETYGVFDAGNYIGAYGAKRR